MGFPRKSNSVVPVTLTYYLTNSDTGESESEKTVVRFVFKRLTDRAVQNGKQEGILETSSDPEVLRLLHQRLAEPPRGFDNWPTEGTLDEQIDRFFLPQISEDMTEEEIEKEQLDAKVVQSVAESALKLGLNAIYPQEFFRGV